MSKDLVTLEETATDVQRALNILIKAPGVDPRAELVNNVYPLFLSLIEAVNTRCLSAEEMVNRLIEESETIIQPEEADQLEETLGLTEDLCLALNAVDLPDSVRAKVKAVALSVVKSRELLESVSLDFEDEEDAENEDEGTED